MSLPFILNGDNTSQPKSQSAAVIKRPIKKVIEVPNVAKPPPIAVIEKPKIFEVQAPQKILIERIPYKEIQLFSILSRILLDKESNVVISRILKDMSSGKQSVASSNKLIQETIKNNQILFYSWIQIYGQPNNSVQADPLYLTTKTIVDWFERMGFPFLYTLQFIEFLVWAKQNHISNSTVFSMLLNRINSIFSIEWMSDIVKFTHDFIRNYEPFPRISTSCSIKNSSFIVYDEPNNPFAQKFKDGSLLYISKHSKTGFVSRYLTLPAEKFTPSHSKQLNPITSDLFDAFSLNYLSKSFPVGQERGKYGRQRNHQEAVAVVVTKEIHELFENIEVAEHSIDRIVAFSENNPYASYCYKPAGKLAFGPYWDKIEPLLENEQVRNIAIGRCRQLLPGIEDEHQQAISECQMFLETRPTNQFMLMIERPNIPSAFTFPLFDNDSSVFIQHFFFTNSTNRLSSVNWFIQTILPIVQIPDSRSSYSIIHSRLFVVAMWYYALLCSEIKPLLSNDAYELMSWEAALDLAAESIHKKYTKNYDVSLYKCLTEILKSIVQNKVITDEVTAEIYRRFKSKSSCFGHIYPILSKLNSVCSALSLDPHTQILCHRAELFSRYGRKKSFNARTSFYNRSFTTIRSKLYLITSDSQNGIVFVKNI